MNTDIEQRVRRGLSTASAPPDLTLDAAEVTRLSSRAYQRRRTGQSVVVGATALTVVASAAWAGGLLPQSVQRALPAAPWSACPLGPSEDGTHTVIHTDRLDPVVVPVAGGGSLLAGFTQACGESTIVLGSIEGDSPTVPAELTSQGGASWEGRAAPAFWIQQVEVGDRHALALLLPQEAIAAQLIGPTQSQFVDLSSAADLPGTALQVVAAADQLHSGDELATLVERDENLTTEWGPGVVNRAYVGTSDDYARSSTWVALDRLGQLWAMHDGSVLGPYLVADPVRGNATPTEHVNAPVAIDLGALKPGEQDASSHGSVERTYLVVAPVPGEVTVAETAPSPDAAASAATLLSTTQMHSDTLTPLYAELVTVEAATQEHSVHLTWAQSGESDGQPVSLLTP
ncbi:hypothetical protein ACQBAT_07715 [Ornithinimicrobium sp. Y1847]|uniref:hypothetical protein n=1 Tax=unclassified Ornithinimicrobium TaxID=2615080 RepID=UPI003B676E32